MAHRIRFRRSHNRTHPLVRHRRSTAGGTSYKTLGLAAASGVAAIVGIGFLAAMKGSVGDSYRAHWYIAPALLGAGGLVLAKRMPTIAVSLVAAAGVVAYLGFKANSDAQAPADKGSAGFYDAAGAFPRHFRGDSGLYEYGGNAGALLNAQNAPFTGAGVLHGLGAQSGNLQNTTAGALMGTGATSRRTSAGSLEG